MSLSREIASKIVKTVDNDPNCRSRINSFLSSLPDSMPKGLIRNVLWAGWAKLIGYDLLKIDSAYQWVCLGISDAACSALSKANFPFIVNSFSAPNNECDHWGAMIYMKDGSCYIFDWWATLDTKNPVICLADEWKADKGGVLYSNFTGFMSNSAMPKAVVRPQRKKANVGKTYVVKQGDTLSAIAQKEYGSALLWSKIYEANRSVIGTNPNSIRASMKLVIPPAS